jgi:hypothetical protein
VERYHARVLTYFNVTNSQNGNKNFMIIAFRLLKEKSMKFVSSMQNRKLFTKERFSEREKQ